MNRPQPPEGHEPPPAVPPPLPPTALLALLALLLMMLVMFQRLGTPDPGTPRVEVSYSEFLRLVEQRRVETVTLRGDRIEGELRGLWPLGPDRVETGRFASRVPARGDERLLPALQAAGVEVRAEAEADEAPGRTLLMLLPTFLILGLLLWFFYRASRTMGDQLGGRGDLRRFLDQSSHEAEIPKVTFADVAGQESAKREVVEIVECLKNPEAFQHVGAQIPRGVLMMGPPGTGKTLMARALAGEAGVPFYSISGSEFIEVFVGVGASRVRRLFEQAKKHAPSIVFIDELDSIGRTRGTGLGGGHDEREQTLNQILAEMDGFAGHEAVIVLAATNRPDVLDPALLRPGRFDRHLTLELPSRADRVALLRVHTRKVPLAVDVDFERVAAGTPGFSGADIRNLVNEAAILAVREHREDVTMRDFDDARDRILMGSVRTLAIQPDERHRLAVHEAGHALVAHCLPEADPLYKVTIIPRGRALGGTQQLPEQDRHMLTESYLRDRLAVTLGGRSAEKAILGSVSSGADDDIRQATSLARAMVSRWGMAAGIGPVDLSVSEEMPFLGREIAQPRRHSEHAAEAVDEAVTALLTEAEQRATAVIEEQRPAFLRLVAALEEQETLDRNGILACLDPEAAGEGAGGAQETSRSAGAARAHEPTPVPPEVPPGRPDEQPAPPAPPQEIPPDAPQEIPGDSPPELPQDTPQEIPGGTPPELTGHDPDAGENRRRISRLRIPRR